MFASTVWKSTSDLVTGRGQRRIDGGGPYLISTQASTTTRARPLRVFVGSAPAAGAWAARVAPAAEMLRRIRRSGPVRALRRSREAGSAAGLALASASPPRILEIFIV